MWYYEYKTVNSDFRVNEILNVVLDGGNYYYFLLYKDGLRTMDVIDFISSEFKIELSDITYAGLKDEDAVTLQFIAIKNRKLDNYQRVMGEKSFSLNYVGASEIPIRIGELQGNSFRIRLRNLDNHIAEKVKRWEKHSISIINYFGIQRFGMPGKEKVTHKIGENIILNNFEDAFKLLFLSGNINLAEFNRYKNSAKDFFDGLDLRRKNFYLAAHDSFIWNNRVMEVIKTYNCEIQCYNIEGINYMYVNSLDNEVRSALSQIDILWNRYDESGNIQQSSSFRQPYIELMYRGSDIMDDDIYFEKKMIDLNFVLPAGAYATNAIDQLMVLLESRK